jgi:uncharacterized protein YhaN
MKIKDVCIDRFGVWQGLQVPLSESGVTVFYGPNEAGKSTLMRFVRGVLYGFRPQPERASRPGAGSTEARGSLRILDAGRAHVIRRESDGESRGRVRIDELDWGPPSETRLKSFLGDTSDTLYENVFAIGLSELQELATLNGDEVAEHIYGISLGPDGDRVLRARSAFEQERLRLLHDDRKSGALVEAARRLEALDRQLAEVGDASHRHDTLRSERDRLSREIEDAQRRRRELERQLRGYRFLDRAYVPWKRERQLRAEREALPFMGTLPEDGLARLDGIERELTTAQQQRQTLLNEARRLARDADDSESAQFLQHECTINRLADRLDELKLRQQHLADKRAELESLQQSARTKSTRAPARGTGERSDSPTSGLVRLLEAARNYQSALARRARTVRRYKAYVTQSQRQQAEFNERIKPLGGTSLVQAIRAVQRRMNDLREFTRLRVEESRLSALASLPRRPLAGASEIRDLPPLFYVLLWFFTFAGIILFFAGLWGAATNHVAGGNTAIIVGMIYACFGLFMAGASWTVKQHLEQYYETPEWTSTGVTLIPKEGDAPEPDVDLALARVRQAIADLTHANPVPGTPRVIGPTEHDVNESDVLIRTAHRLADLHTLRKEEQKIHDRRQKLSKSREILRERQRDVGRRRREWCEVLRSLGLDETLKLDKAFEAWHIACGTSEAHRDLSRLQGEVDAEQRSCEETRRHIDRLIAQLPETSLVGLKSDPDRIIAHWRTQLQQYNSLQSERARQRSEARNRKREAERLETRIRELSSSRSELLLRAGVSSRDELELRLKSAVRQRELERQLDEAQTELQLIGESEPELAIVEEDLRAFNPANNRRAADRIEQELQQLDRDLQTAHEELGRVKRELQELAHDRRAVSLRFEREQIFADLQREVEALCAVDFSTAAVDRIRERLERHGQTGTLQLASTYLDRLTCGKYDNIWTPLGQRYLSIDDDTDQTYRVEQLSTGTREQLFLAIRLAMIRRFAEEGIELPMVLDDVFVNFDQVRTEAAVDTVLDFAQHGQQILLFTCHQHLAHLFEAKGIKPVWLPSNTAPLEERRAG